METSNYNKVFIGNGQQDQKFQENVDVNICLDDAERFIFTSEKTGKRYLRFKVAKMKNEDQFKNTHTVYILEKAVEETAPQAPKAKPKRAKK